MDCIRNWYYCLPLGRIIRWLEVGSGEIVHPFLPLNFKPGDYYLIRNINKNFKNAREFSIFCFILFLDSDVIYASHVI